MSLPRACSLPSSLFRFLHQSAVQVHQFSLALLFSLSSWDPCHLVCHCVPTSHCIRDVVAVCSISGTLATGSPWCPHWLLCHRFSCCLFFWAPTLIFVSLWSTLSSVSLLWYSASRAISHITDITYLSAPALGLRHVTREQEVGLGSEVQIHTLWLQPGPCCLVVLLVLNFISHPAKSRV